jgi:hypothetical protein
MARRTLAHRRRIGGRRKAAPRIGLRPVILFCALCALAAIAGITLEQELRKPTLVQTLPILKDRP